MNDGIEARFDVGLDQFALKVDLRLPGRGVVALFGPSGSGKTTLLRCFAGLQSGAAGFLRVNGESWQDDSQGHFLAPHRRSLGYVFQQSNLFAHLSVKGNLEYGMNRVPASRRKVAWQQAIELLGMETLLGRMPNDLSTGERQRVAIARALLTSPGLLLFDEPLASLDLARKQEVLPYLARLRDELSIPMLYVSHSPDEVARLADHLVVLDKGKVVAAGPLAETLSTLDLPIRLGEDVGAVVEGVVGECDLQWHLTRVDFEGGSLWARDTGAILGARVRVRILARDVSIARGKFDSSITNVLPAVVVGQGEDEHPGLTLVRLQIGAQFVLARLTRRAAADLELTVGLQVWAQIKAVSLNI